MLTGLGTQNKGSMYLQFDGYEILYLINLVIQRGGGIQTTIVDELSVGSYHGRFEGIVVVMIRDPS